MNALIVSKTKMNHGVCVGAILYDGTAIRLLDAHGNNQPSNSAYNIGDVWDLTWNPRPSTTEPHNEDVLITSSSFVKKEINVTTTLLKTLNVPFWQSNPDNLFDGLIRWTNNGSGYISHRTGVPNHSVGFYIGDQDLKKYDDSHYYFMGEGPFSPIKKIAYVGLQPMIEIIPKGTLIRISLARWWTNDPTMETRCYAQISGWYTNSSTIKEKSDKYIAVEKDGIWAIYEFTESDSIETLAISDQINWLDITERKVKRRSTGEYVTRSNGESVFWAEKAK